jgi:peptidoglycan hydrolase-like protein with peptidoglycan-binding domain
MRFNEFKIVKEADSITLGPTGAAPGAPPTKDKPVARAFRPDGTFYVEVPTGRKGTAVADVQKALIALGYPLPSYGVDGQRGPETTAAVKKFQTDNGLTADGNPGPNTVAKINDVLKAKPDVAKTLNKTTPAELDAPRAVPGSDVKGAIKKVIGAGAGFTDVETVDGEQFRRTGDRNWRNNNPGNLEFAGGFSKSRGAVGHDGRFAVFPTMEIGMKAKEDLVFGKNYINLSIQGAIAKYAPESDGNKVGMYVNQIVQATKASPDTILKDLTPEQRTAMLDTINRVEGFKPGKVLALAPTPTTTA